MNRYEELTRLSATELSYLIRSRKVSALEVVNAHLDRIEQVNPKVNAFCTVVEDEARKAAKAADEAVASGTRLGPLHGLPVALKDLTPTKGIRTTRGSRLFKDTVPQQDALIVQRIRQAGGIIIGKTNTPEFGHKGVTDNLIFGPTRNPWNLERTAGGSSGGASAAVAAGLVPLAEGSDGAGSIRIPSSLCGVFGFKPTYGRIPDVQGAFTSHSPFFHNGPISRTVTDATLFYDALAGAHDTDPFSIPKGEDALVSLDDGIRGLSVAYCPDLGYFQIDPEVREACDCAARLFGDLGCNVEAIKMDFHQDIEQQFFILWCGKLASLYGDLPDQQMALLETKVQELIVEGKRLSAVDYGRANLAREKVWDELLKVYSRFDLLICPTTAVAAFPLAQGAPTAINGQSINTLLGWFLTYPFNLTGNPVSSVPCGFSQDGLPIGLQIAGRRLDDGTVLRASRNFERAAPWTKTLPLQDNNP